MESIDRLRKYVKANTNETEALTTYPLQYEVRCTTIVNDLIDAIEREIDSHYVLLPEDENGIPIHIGDEIEYGKVHRIEIADDGDHKVYFSTRPDNPQLDWRLCRYVRHKPPTVEDVLREFFARYVTTKPKEEDDAIIAEYAAKLQLRGEHDG